MEKPVKKERKPKYEDKLQVKEGTTFMDLMKASVKNANDKSAPKKEDKL